MDSLTQIVLGAACGEIALGKKIGNKALLFGAIGGTIPDLDVFIGPLLYSNEIDAMAFHRGFMHSILFAIIASPIIGWLTFKLYNTGKRYNTTTFKDWILLFFLSILTHPILDSFTPYGTQLFSPFSNYRVAFNNISVADPMYTLPFLVCLIVLMCYKRNTNKRKLWLKLALGISSLYMLFTIGNRFYIHSVFKKSLEEQGIAYQRFSVQPTILNNVLWFGIAETKDDYKAGFYSLLDSSSVFSNWQSLPKNHHILSKENSDLKTLTWFSNEYYNLEELDNNLIRYNDLRYPLLNPDDPKSSVFSMYLFKDGNRLNMKDFEPEEPKRKDVKQFWERIKGN